MNNLVNHKLPWQLLAFSKLSLINLSAVVALFGLVITYSFNLLQQSQLAAFTRYYADFTFLILILFSIARHLKNPTSIVDPIYWLLLGSAFTGWFLLTIFRITISEEISTTNGQLVTKFIYFLYYSLVIAAIEVKSYKKADHLLSRQSLLIWTSSFTFVLGAFTFLVLASTTEINNNQIGLFDSEFVFYILLDCYLLVRWWYLAWTCRQNAWMGFFLLGVGSLFFGCADLIEGLATANIITTQLGSWTDWFWFAPYILTYIALQMPVATSIEQNISRSFSRSHLFNSPLFFVAIGFLLFFLYHNKQATFGVINSTQAFVLNLWLMISLGLALIQFWMLNSQQRQQKRRLVDIKISNQAMQQRMIQQAHKLEAQSASNKAILETTHNAIFTLDFDGQILSCNPAACNLLKYPHSQLIGENFNDKLQVDGELARFFTYQSYRQKLATQTGGIELESQVIRSDNKNVPVHATLSQEKNKNQGLLVISLVNISEQKKAEAEAHELKDQFTANISHEFRTPLTIINGVLDNLLSQDKYQDDQEQLQTAKRNGLRMVRMVEQLLELSRIANDSVPLSSINALSIIQFVCASFEEIAKNSQLKFEINLPKDAWIKGNSQAFEKILFNLLSNAFKYTEQGSVLVSLANVKNSFELHVTDTGIGINEEQQALIFERFHRVDNKTTQSVHGVGIGLALVKELCNTMFWDLKLKSEPNIGSHFIITMPKGESSQNKITDGHTNHAHSSLNKSIESEVIDARSRRSNKPIQKSDYSVLIVEDNLDMQAHINSILSPYHQCLLANNGEEGVRLAIDYVPDIIVSDVMMPGISGFQLLKTLKKTEMTSHIPIILLTARSDSASKIIGLQAQADDYLSKPFDAQELRLRVNNQLSSREKLQLRLNNRSQQYATVSDQEDLPEEAIEDKFLLKLDQIFDEHYTNSEFSMLDLADLLAMSDRQVQRKIKAVLGVSPLEALKQFRLKQAEKLLSAGEQIGIVAQACGFSSQSYFGRCFKEAYKTTPKAYQTSKKDV